MSNNIKLLLEYVKGYKGNLLIVFCSLFLVATSLLLIGWVFRHLVDNGLNINNLHFINDSIFLLFILIGLFAVGSFFRSYFINLVTEKIIAQIKTDTYKNLLQLEIATFEELKIGDIISRLSSDLESVGNLISNFLSFFIRNSIMLIGAIFMMFLQSPKLSIMVIITIPILLVPILRLSNHVRSISKKVMNEKAELFNFIEESFFGIRTLYSFNQQIHSIEKFSDKMNFYLKHSASRLRLRSLFFALAILVIAGSITTVIWVGSVDIISNKMTSGQMVSFIYYAIMVGMSGGGIAELFSELQGPLAALDRIFELRFLKSNKEVFITTDEFHQDTFEEFLAFKNVTFSYPSRPSVKVLDDVSFDIKPQQFIGIVGKSGSGKSTIMQLLLGFYQFSTGNIVVCGKALHAYQLNDLRKLIGYAPQDPTIFSGSIRSNIMFSKPDATPEEFENVIKLCGIDKIVKKLPDGIDTEIGEKGVRLSGGQKQRISIARVLLYKPEILLLDESTSALDSESEKEIIDNIKDFMKNKAIISIAHRISSIENADSILVLDQGKILDYGTHSYLLKSCNIYLSLYQKQQSH